MAHTKYWCLECKDRCLTWKCSKHGDFPVIHHSAKLRVPDFSNKVKFRKFVLDVHIFFNCVTPEQEVLMRKITSELKLTGINVNGRIL